VREGGERRTCGTEEGQSMSKNEVEGFHRTSQKNSTKGAAFIVMREGGATLAIKQKASSCGVGGKERVDGDVMGGKENCPRPNKFNTDSDINSSAS